MSKKKKIVPELRFPEFVNDADWKPVRIEELIEQHIEKSDYSNQYPVLTSSRDGIMFQRDYYNNRDVASLDNTGYNVVPRGYFTYRHMSDDLVFKFNINTICDRGIVSTLYPVFSAKETKVIPFFLQTVLNEGQEFKNFAISQKQGGSRTYMYLSKLKELQIAIPGVLEQRKIATCLSSLDEVIVAHKQKLDLLKDHKKSLMQNLFPKRGEKVPRYRFEEFVKDGEWVERKLEELAKRGSGHTPNKKVSNYYNGGIKWVSLADSNKLDNRYIYDTKIQISKEGIENSSAVLHPAGTVILSRDAGVGKSAVLYSEMAVSQHFIVWVCEESKLSNWFLYYVFQILKPAFESIAVGSTIKTIGLPYFKELLIVVPSINEQLKIASCLFSIDELIAAQAEKIEQLKLHKKGLMQGLFPKMID